MKIERLTATEFDAVRAGEFLLNFAREHKFGSMPPATVNVEKSWERVWRMLDEGVVWIATSDDDAIAGSLSVMKTELWWADVAYLSDGWFFVHEDRRGSAAALMLINAATEYANALGLPLVINVFHGANPALVGKFLGRMGFSMLGGTYIKEP